MPPKKKSTNKPTETLGLEDALAQIEEIVDLMDSEELPLEKLVEKYEAGSKLLKHCDSVLTSAKKRIELISLDAKAPENAESESSTTTDQNESNDRSLF